MSFVLSGRNMMGGSELGGTFLMAENVTRKLTSNQRNYVLNKNFVFVRNIVVYFTSVGTTLEITRI